MVKRAWIAVSVLWTLFWWAVPILSYAGQPLPQSTANLFFLISLVPWVAGLIVRWVVAADQ